MKVAIQITIMLVMCLAGLWLCRELTNISAPNADERLWQEGVWHIQDTVAQRVTTILADEEGSEPNRVATVSIRTSADCQWAFSSLTSTELSEFLRSQYEATGKHDVRFTPIEDADHERTPDLQIQLEILELTGNGEEETLRCLLTVKGQGRSEEAYPVEAACPLGHRNWFVQPRRVPATWLCLAGVLCILGMTCLGLGAWQAFVMEYAGNHRMWCGTIAFVAGAGFLLTNWVFGPATRTIRVPSQQIDIVLETSDAVLFPVSTGSDAQNALARFMQSSTACLSRELNSGLTDEGELSFRQWVHSMLTMLTFKNQQSETLQRMSSANMRVYRALPGRLDDPKSALEYIPVEDLPTALKCGRRGIETGFFLPWNTREQTLLPAARTRLVLVFTTGEAGSVQEADRLQRDLDRLCEDKPDSVRIFTVMLPSVPRSSESFEFEEERLLRLSKMSDWLISVNTSDTTAAKMLGECEVMPPLSLYTCPSLGGDNREIWARPTDLDARRVQLFGHLDQHAQEQTEQAAGRLAQHVSAKVAWERIPVFQLDRSIMWAFVAMVGLLLLFLSLQDELTLLEFQSDVPRGRLWGRVLGMILGPLGCLYLVYSLRNTSLWTIRGEYGLTLWAVSWIWFCILWLPYLVGSGSRQLTAPKNRLHTRHLFWLVIGAAVLLCGTLSLGTFLRATRGEAISLSNPDGREGRVCLHLLYASDALLLLLSIWFLWNRFARGRRMWTVGIGTSSVLLLLWLPQLGSWLDTFTVLGYPLIIWIWLAAIIGPMLTCLIFREAVSPGYRPGAWQLGWRWLILLGLALPSLVGLVHGPVVALRFGGYWETCVVTWLFPCLIVFAALLPRVLGEIGWLGQRKT